MVKLTVWTFPTPYGAGAVVARLKKLSAHRLIHLHDAALIVWLPGRMAPTIQPLADLPRLLGLDDAFWGLFAGVIFHRPHSTSGATVSKHNLEYGMAALGLNAELLETVRNRVVEGTSALVLLTDSEVVRRITQAFEGMNFTLLEAPISDGEARFLRITFSIHAD